MPTHHANAMHAIAHLVRHARATADALYASRTDLQRASLPGFLSDADTLTYWANQAERTLDAYMYQTALPEAMKDDLVYALLVMNGIDTGEVAA